jgi:rare lipoprotein A (peptidoglycan hydrolase)
MKEANADQLRSDIDRVRTANSCGETVSYGQRPGADFGAAAACSERQRLGPVATLSPKPRKVRDNSTCAGKPEFCLWATSAETRMNSGGLTAAHRSLPFGSKVGVTNNHTGRSVVVRINDRGPFVKGRVIDLSPAAARAIGVNGLAQVSLSSN